MNKIIKYAPIVSAVVWLVCLILAIFKPTDYRIEFIIAAAVLVINNILLWSDRNDRKTNESDNESGQEPESDNNDQ